MNEVFDSSRLELLNEAKNFTNWLYSKYKPHIKGRILEVSSGVGTYALKIIKDFPKNDLTLTEYSEEDVNELKIRFKNEKIRCKKLDMNKKMDFERIGEEKFDTIICSNVLEHIENDDFALSECYKILNKNGKLVLVVPQNPKLYSNQDKALRHYRRYSRSELIRKIEKNGFKIISLKNFNNLGILGWKMNKNSNKTENNPKLIKIFNIIIPLIKTIDDSISAKFSGLSLIAILEKN
jgi:ubiquinone/menaquinone biosynthesis C-methylase UbiE